MLMYVLIGLALVLTGIVGLQFTYLYYVDRILKERKSYLRCLEQEHARMRERLDTAERQLAERNAFAEQESWADVIEEA